MSQPNRDDLHYSDSYSYGYSRGNTDEQGGDSSDDKIHEAYVGMRELVDRGATASMEYVRTDDMRLCSDPAAALETSTLESPLIAHLQAQSRRENY
jgi:hypothetical protein